MNRHPNDEMLLDYVRDLLPDNDLTQLAAHIDSCEDCQQRVSQMEQEALRWQRHFSAELQQQRPSPNANFAALRPKLRKKRSISMNKIATILAPIALILLISVGIYTAWPQPVEEIETAFNETPTVSNETPTVEPTVEPTPEPTLEPLAAAMENLAYIPFGGSEPLTLVDGQIGDVTLDQYVLGDLNGDGLDDVAFVVVKSFEDSRFPEVGVAFNNGDDTLTHVSNEFLYPNAEVALSIVGSQVIVAIDAPDLQVSTITYVVSNGRLVQPAMITGETDEDAQYQEYLQSEWAAGVPTPADSILTRETLSNMVYPSDYTSSSTAPLIAATYREAPRTTVRLLPQHLYGDLTGDDVAEAVVLLGTSTGGSGTFVELVVVTIVDGQPQPIASQFLGDRADVVMGQIADGILTIDVDGETQMLRYEAGVLHKVEE